MEISIKEKNEKFMGLLILSGKFENFNRDKLKELLDSKIDLEETSKTLKKFIMKYDRNADFDEIYTNSLYLCTSIVNYHECEDFNDFLDKFLKLYELSSASKEMRRLYNLNSNLTHILMSHHYKVDFDTLKIRHVHDRISYQDVDLRCRIDYECIDDDDVFSELILNNGERIYAYIVKNGKIAKVCNVKYAGIDDDYSCEWIWVKNNREVIDIIFKRDYDFIFIRPFIHNGLKAFNKIDIHDMDNERFIDLLDLVGKFGIVNLEDIGKINKVINSDWDLKELIRTIIGMKYCNIGLSDEKLVDMLVMLVDKLDKYDKEYGYKKLKLLESIFDKFNYCTMKEDIFLDKLDDMLKLRECDLDTFVMSAKLLDTDSVHKIDMGYFNKKYIDKDCFYIVYGNNHIKKSNNLYKVKKELGRDDVCIVIIPSRFDKNSLLE